MKVSKNKQLVGFFRPLLRIATMVVALLFFLPCGAQMPKNLLYQPFNEKSKGLGSLYKNHFANDSVEAFAVFDNWIGWAEKQDDPELTAMLHGLKIHYYNSGKQYNYPAFETQIQALIEETNKAKLYRVSLWAQILQANFYFRKVNNYAEAFNGYRNLYNRIIKGDKDAITFKMDVLVQYGTLFYFFNDYAQTKKLFREALSESDTIYTGINFHLPNAQELLGVFFHLYNTLGLVHRKTEEYDSSHYYFDKAYQIGIEKNDSAFIAIALGNKGHNYFYQKEYDAAVPLLEIDAAICSRNRFDIGNAAVAMNTLAQISFHKNDLDKAKEQALLALSWLRQAYTRQEEIHFSQAYQLLAKIYSQQNNPDLAYIYSDSAFISKEVYTQKMTTQTLLKAKLDLDAEEYDHKLQLLETKQKEQVLLRNSVIVFLLLLMFIVLLYFRQRHDTYRQKERLAQEELVMAKERLFAFTKNLFEKNKMIENLQDELSIYNEDSVSTLNQHTILTEADWIKFRDLFDKVHIGYLQRLKEIFPGLSAADTRFIALAKLNFTTAQMANALGISTNSVRMTKSRLRKKLNLKENESIEELINKI